jgi:hypothetical protein
VASSGRLLLASTRLVSPESLLSFQYIAWRSGQTVDWCYKVCTFASLLLYEHGYNHFRAVQQYQAPRDFRHELQSFSSR